MELISLILSLPEKKQHMCNISKSIICLHISLYVDTYQLTHMQSRVNKTVLQTLRCQYKLKSNNNAVFFKLEVETEHFPTIS